LSAFAVFALLLTTVGVYGVISYLVSQSKHDLGIRIALGAQPGNIVGLVLKQGMTLTVAGVVAGLLGAAGLTRVMASLLFGVKATDTLTFGTVAGVLIVAAFLATVIPAQRATRVDPMTVLRED
jgi:putative ABC transport system permease protein